MTALDDLIRETLGARAHDVDHVRLDVPPPRPSRRWVAIGTVAALAAAIVVAVVLVAPWRDTSPRTAVPADTTPSALPTPPAGDQWVSFHGITLTVPTTWAVGSYDCGTSSAPGVVDVALSNAQCAVKRPDDQTFVRLTPLGTMPPQGTATTVGGHPAYQLTWSRGGPTSVAWFMVQLRDAGVLMEVRLPVGDTAGPARVLAAVEYTPVDHLGCAAQAPRLTDTLGYRAAPISTSDATSGVVCDYLDGTTLFGSRVLTAADLDRLSVVAAGAAPAAPGDTGEERDHLVYRLREADGRGLILDVGLGTSTTFFDNRDRWARRDGVAADLPRAFP